MNLGPYQISYWQKGCNDAKSGKPYNESMRYEGGYDNGFYFGQHGKGRHDDSYWPSADSHVCAKADPPLKNPYMEGIEAIEGIMERMEKFAMTFPAELDNRAQEQYREHLLLVRDTLHAMRQQEMLDVGQV